MLTGIFTMNGLAHSTSIANLQAHDSFQQRMDCYVSTFLAQENLLIRVKGEYEDFYYQCEGHEEFMKKAISLAKTKFVKQHLEEFKRMYMNTKAPAMVTTSVCDNGGFENGFTGYSGSSGVFDEGSNSCNPMESGFSTVFTSASLPSGLRFEIVSSGKDTLVGIDKTRFGSKALLINNRYGIPNGQHDSCWHSTEINKISKEFTVTQNNRVFSIWYAVVLENPSQHEDDQPFFSITCDLSPESDLCFDADVLSCEQEYIDSSEFCTYDSIDVLDWSCHRIIIPESEIGNIATLEILVADCAKGDHFGYAYIDGICENCVGGEQGSIRLFPIDTCDFDSTICGDYELPEICGLTWLLDSLIIPGYDIEDLEINHENQSFCFKLPSDNLTGDTCVNIMAKAVFNNGTLDANAVYSNTVEICDQYYTPFINSIVTSGCNDNGTGDFLSDDYYYVDVQIQRAAGLSWAISQELDEPYPNESGERNLDSGTGNGTIRLGPFYIQEGSWELTIVVGDCVFNAPIIPPNYCPTCNDLSEVVIDNVQCNEMTDTWSFDLFVPGSGNYNLKYNGSASSGTRGQINTVSGISFDEECRNYEIAFGQCEASFTICPPKPCDEECDLDAYIESVSCSVDGSTVEFSVDLNVSGYSNYLCYEAKSTGGGINPTLSTGQLTGSQTIGTFTQEIYIVLYECENADCSTDCTPPTCFKVIYVPVPDSDLCIEEFLVGNTSDKESPKMLSISPNPSRGDGFVVISEINNLDYKIVDLGGKSIQSGVFQKGSQDIYIEGPGGVYFLQYKNEAGKVTSVELIKMR